MLFEILTPPQLRFTLNTKFNGKIWEQVFGTDLPQTVSFSIYSNDEVSLFPSSHMDGRSRIEINLSPFQVAEGVTCKSNGWEMKQEKGIIFLFLADKSKILTQQIELELSNLKIQNPNYLEGKGLGGVQKEFALPISFENVRFNKANLLTSTKFNAICTVKVGLPPRSFGQ